MGNINVPFGFIQNDKIYLSGQAGLPDREIGIVKNGDEETSVKYFENKYELFRQKVDELEKQIKESENKGSFLMKLLHMKKLTRSHNGLGDYIVLHTRLEELEKEIRNEILENQQRNTAIKKDLLDDLNEAIKIPDWQVASSKLKDIKRLWKETGNATEDQRTKLDLELNMKYDFFFERKKAVEQNQREQNERRAQKYEAIIDELKSLINSKDPKARIRMRDLQSKFLEVGSIPKKHFAKYQKEYDFVISKLTNKTKTILPPRRTTPKMLTDDEMDKNYEKKLDLIRQVNELKQDPSIPKASRLRDIWKAIGPVPRDKSTQISLEFYDGISFVYEVNYLEKVCRELYDDWDDFSIKKQTEIKIEKLSELKSVDERELEAVMDNKWNLTTSEGSISKKINEKLVIQKRKIRVKTQIMDILQGFYQSL